MRFPDNLTQNASNRKIPNQLPPLTESFRPCLPAQPSPLDGPFGSPRIKALKARSPTSLHIRWSQGALAAAAQRAVASRIPAVARSRLAVASVALSLRNGLLLCLPFAEASRRRLLFFLASAPAAAASGSPSPSLPYPVLRQFRLDVGSLSISDLRTLLVVVWFLIFFRVRVFD